MADDDKKKSEAYQLDELDKKEEPGEDAPLKSNDTDVEAGDPIEAKDSEKLAEDGEKKDSDAKSTTQLLGHPKAKLYLAVGSAAIIIILLAAAAVALFLMRGWSPDPTWRYMRLIPQPNGPQNLIKFRRGALPYEGRDWPSLVDQIKRMLDTYNPVNVMAYNPNVTECIGGQKMTRDRVCLFEIQRLSGCLEPPFGYETGRPCVFLQFTNISGYQPTFFTNEDQLQQAPRNIRDNLTAVVRSQVALIECKGNTPVDEEYLGTDIEYIPTQGFPSMYFPYTGQRAYTPPLVAVKFNSIRNGVAVGITCRLWDPTLNETEIEPKPILPFNLLVE